MRLGRGAQDGCWSMWCQQAGAGRQKTTHLAYSSVLGAATAGALAAWDVQGEGVYVNLADIWLPAYARVAQSVVSALLKSAGVRPLQS